MNTDEFLAVEDVLYPSDNHYDIPCLRLDRQASNLVLPFAPYGTGRQMRKAKTIHFYVDDYRFEGLWKTPAKLFAVAPKAIVEPNFSVYDTTPVAYGLQQIYRKRWLSRYWQEWGLLVYADLNVSSKFYEFNKLGIPQGYNAFATRGTYRKVDRLEAEHTIARQISGLDHPNLIVYGGGNEIHEYCCKHSLVYIHDFMSMKGGEDNG